MFDVNIVLGYSRVSRKTVELLVEVAVLALVSIISMFTLILVVLQMVTILNWCP